ncbi:hypothetical protein MNBD_CHLOROFLEXI01-4486, partial [hydrothermal vent metagenome]
MNKKLNDYTGVCKKLNIAAAEPVEAKAVCASRLRLRQAQATTICIVTKIKHILLLPVALFLLAGCSAAVQETAATEPSLPVGPTTYCQTLPTFVQEIGFTQPFLSTSLPDYIGAALGDLDSAGNLINVYQHP